MSDLLARLISGALTRRGGVALLLGLACAAVGSGVVAHDGAEGQAAGAAAGVVVALGAVGVGKLVMDYVAKRGGDQPPAGPAT